MRRNCKRQHLGQALVLVAQMVGIFLPDMLHREEGRHRAPTMNQGNSRVEALRKPKSISQANSVIQAT